METSSGGGVLWRGGPLTPLGVPMRFECWWGVECCLLVLVLDGGVVMVGGVWGGGGLWTNQNAIIPELDPLDLHVVFFF